MLIVYFFAGVLTSLVGGSILLGIAHYLIRPREVRKPRWVAPETIEQEPIEQPAPERKPLWCTRYGRLNPGEVYVAIYQQKQQLRMLVEYLSREPNEFYRFDSSAESPARFYLELKRMVDDVETLFSELDQSRIKRAVLIAVTEHAKSVMTNKK